MALSKVKSNKQKLRLAARVESWTKIPATDQKGYKKPGSNKK